MDSKIEDAREEKWIKDIILAIGAKGGEHFLKLTDKARHTINKQTLRALLRVFFIYNKS